MTLDPFDDRLYEPINEVKGWQKPPDPNSRRTFKKQEDIAYAEDAAKYDEWRQAEMAKREEQGFKHPGNMAEGDWKTLAAQFRSRILAAKKAGVFTPPHKKTHDVKYGAFGMFPSSDRFNFETQDFFDKKIKEMVYAFMKEHRLRSEIPPYRGGSPWAKYEFRRGPRATDYRYGDTASILRSVAIRALGIEEAMYDSFDHLQDPDPNGY